MLPTIADNQVLLVKGINSNSDIQLDDILLFEMHNNLYVKRLKGTSNQVLDYSNTYIKLKSLDEIQPIKLGNWHFKYLENYSDNYLKIPNDCYFFLGDNLQNSKDSRKMGFIKRSQIKGKVILVF